MTTVKSSVVNPKIQEIVNKYMDIAKVGRNRVRAMAKSLGVSYASVSCWSTGSSVPSMLYLFDLRDRYKDWRWDFATDILTVMLPTSEMLSDRDGHPVAINPCEICGADRLIK
jgi:hypothetical protein